MFCEFVTVVLTVISPFCHASSGNLFPAMARYRVIADGDASPLNFPSELLEKIKTGMGWGWGTPPTPPPYQSVGDQWTVHPDWNPALIKNRMMQSLCNNNIIGDYPNPADCNQIIQCFGSPDRVYLMMCPTSLVYLPPSDICSSAKSNTECPLKSVWDNRKVPPTCANIGQRSWGTELTLPTYPAILCGRDIIFCKNFKVVRQGTCKEGAGYSKAVFGCLPLPICLETEKYFKMPFIIPEYESEYYLIHLGANQTLMQAKPSKEENVPF